MVDDAEAGKERVECLDQTGGLMEEGPVHGDAGGRHRVWACPEHQRHVQHAQNSNAHNWNQKEGTGAPGWLSQGST